MNPPGRREAQLHGDGEADDQRPDDQDQEGRGPVTDIEGFEVEAADPAFAREAGDALEQRPGAAAGTEPAERDEERGWAGVGHVLRYGPSPSSVPTQDER